MIALCNECKSVADVNDSVHLSDFGFAYNYQIPTTFELGFKLRHIPKQNSNNTSMRRMLLDCLELLWVEWESNWAAVAGHVEK